MVIYFAASIRGGRSNADIYPQIINLLKDYGHVLTEHLGDSDLSAQGENRKVEEIFKRDYSWLKSSDVIIAGFAVETIGTQISGYQSFTLPQIIGVPYWLLVSWAYGFILMKRIGFIISMGRPWIPSIR